MGNPRQDFHDSLLRVVGSAVPEGKPSLKSDLRKHLWNIIEHDEGASGRILNMLLFTIVLFSLFTLPAVFIPALSAYEPWIQGVEVITAVILSCEYLLRVFAAPERFRYIFSWQGLVDLFSALPFYVSLLLPQLFWRYTFALLRVVRIFKILHIRSSQDTEEEIRRKSLHFKLMKDEEIEKIAVKHPLFLLRGILLPLILGAASVCILLIGDFKPLVVGVSVFLAIFMGILFYNAWLDYYYDVIYITNFRVISQNKHLFGQNINQVEYRNITNIHPSESGIWSALFGFGEITIETAADEGIINDKNVRNHEEVVRYIEQKCHESGDAQK